MTVLGLFTGGSLTSIYNTMAPFKQDDIERISSVIYGSNNNTTAEGESLPSES